MEVGPPSQRGAGDLRQQGPRQALPAPGSPAGALVRRPHRPGRRRGGGRGRPTHPSNNDCPPTKGTRKAHRMAPHARCRDFNTQASTRVAAFDLVGGARAPGARTPGRRSPSPHPRQHRRRPSWGRTPPADRSHGRGLLSLQDGTLVNTRGPNDFARDEHDWQYYNDKVRRGGSGPLPRPAWQQQGWHSRPAQACAPHWSPQRAQPPAAAPPPTPWDAPRRRSRARCRSCTARATKLSSSRKQPACAGGGGGGCAVQPDSRGQPGRAGRQLSGSRCPACPRDRAFPRRRRHCSRQRRAGPCSPRAPRLPCSNQGGIKSALTGKAATTTKNRIMNLIKDVSARPSSAPGTRLWAACCWAACCWLCLAA